MPQIIIAGVDGTGVDSDSEYAASMAQSYVNQLVARAKQRGAKGDYHRGPTLKGMDTGPLGNWESSLVQRELRNAASPKIVLTGYSRGGASVITAAQLLAFHGVFIDLMVLFDAVDRSITAAAGSIPPNVRKVFHARRSMLACSRLYFGNCGTSRTPFLTSYTEQTFMATHGGVGGVPWWNQSDKPATAMLSDTIYEDGIPTRVSYQQDLNGAAMVWNWMAPKLSSEGVI